MKTPQKTLAPVVTIVLVVAVGIAGFVSFTRAQTNRVAAGIVTVRGVVGSEKASLFSDPDVIREFKRNNLTLDITTQGSREQVTRATKDKADFFFPAGEPAGRAIAKNLGITDPSTPFYTPMVVASWQDIATELAANGIVQKRGNIWYVLHMDKMLALIESDTRWNQLPHNSSYNVGKAILISSTDARKSNSAGMYLALASYVLNGNSVVTSLQQVHRLQDRLDALFLRQGFQESSSAGPFEDYTAIGEGKAPLVMCYEQQFIEYLTSVPVSSRPAGMVLLYPKPTIVTKHTIVPTDDAGRKVADLLQNDPIIRQAEIRHGFRTSDIPAMQTYWRQNHVDLLSDVQDVVDPPTFETLESMIVGLERAYAQQ